MQSRGLAGMPERDLTACVPLVTLLGDEVDDAPGGSGGDSAAAAAAATARGDGDDDDTSHDDGDDLSEATYIGFHTEETVAAAVRTAWLKRGVWEGYLPPFFGTEHTAGMSAAIDRLLKHPSPSLSCANKAVRTKKTVQAVLADALEVLRDVESVYRARCTSAALEHTTRRRDRDGDAAAVCRCALVDSGEPCGAATCLPPEATLTEDRRAGTGFGLVFRGTMLVSVREGTAAAEKASHLVGSRLRSVNGVSMASLEEAQKAIEDERTRVAALPPAKRRRGGSAAAAAAAAASSLTVVFTFFPRYALYDDVSVFGKPLASAALSSAASAAASATASPAAFAATAGAGSATTTASTSSSLSLSSSFAPPATRIAVGGLGVVGVGLRLVHAEPSDTFPDGCIVFRVVDTTRGKGGSGGGRSNERFGRAELRRLHPSPFLVDTPTDYDVLDAYLDGAQQHPADETKGVHDVLVVRRALTRFLAGRKNDDSLRLFMRPVDPVRDRAPGYHSIVKSPMDLGTVLALLRNNVYSAADEVLSDIEQVWENCKAFNPSTHVLHHYASRLSAEFKRIYAEQKRDGDGDAADSPPASRLSSGTSPAPASRRGGLHSPLAEDSLQRDLAAQIEGIPAESSHLLHRAIAVLMSAKVC